MINDFEKRKENIPPEARGDAKWRGMVWRLTLRWIRGIWVGEECFRGVQVGKRFALMGSARLFPCSIVLPSREK